jgi:FkbM family methyltransferase
VRTAGPQQQNGHGEMIRYAKKIMEAANRVRRFRRAMPLQDALRVICARNNSEERLYLKGLERNVRVRTNSTDLNCLEKVFLYKEYSVPFAIEPHLIVDAGANVGMATLFFAHHYPHAKIIAIEPEPANFDLLRQNCDDLPNVSLIRAALWPEACDLAIENPSAEAWAFTIAKHSAHETSKKISAITIDDILKQAHADRIDLLKLDVEGSEFQLFSNGAELWIGKIGMIAIELHDRFRPGCAQAFYSVITKQKFRQEVKGENIFVALNNPEHLAYV